MSVGIEVCEDVLKKSKVVSILLNLLINGEEQSLQSLHEKVGGSMTTLYEAIQLLEMKNLIHIRREDRRMRLSLTPTGYDVAEHLKAIMHLLR